MSETSTLKLLCCLSLMLALSACTGAQISRSPLAPEFLRLESMGLKTLGLKVTNAPINQTAGRQFLLIAIPFGTVSIGDPRLDIETELRQALALRGYRSILGTPGAKGPRLEATICSISVQAYDFLLIRRLVAKVNIRGTLTLPGQPARTVSVTGEASEYRRFGFSQQLTHVYEGALEDAASKLLNDLELYTLK